MTFGPPDLRLIARRLIGAADPDAPAPAPDDTAAQPGRHLELRPMRDGMWRIEGRLTAETGAQLSAVLAPLTKPMPPTPSVRSAGSPGCYPLGTLARALSARRIR